MKWLRRVPAGTWQEIDRFWDSVVGQRPGLPLPTPVRSDELTTVIQTIHAAAPSNDVQPEYADRLLARLIAVQQEMPNMTHAIAGARQYNDVARVYPQHKQRAIDGPWRWAAVAATFLVFAVLVGTWLVNRPDNGNAPAVVAPTAVASPNATPDQVSPGISLLWRAGLGSEAMLYPVEAAIAPDGSIWSIDGSRGKIRIYSTSGELLDAWGTPGSEPGQFNFLLDPLNTDSTAGGIAFDAAGNVYVLDGGNYRVQVFDKNRNLVTSWGSRGGGTGQFLSAASLAVAADGTVSVLDFARNIIQQFKADGTYIGKIGAPGSNPGQLADTGYVSLAPDGTLWVADWGNSRVESFGPNGQFVQGWGEKGTGPGLFQTPIDVAVDAQGHVLVADWDGSDIQLFDATGHYLGAITDTEAEGTMIPSAVTVDGDGNVVVTDFGRGQLLKYHVDWANLSASDQVINLVDATSPSVPSVVGAPETSVREKWSTADSVVPAGGAISATLAPDGSVWVVDPVMQAIRIFSADGTWQEDWTEADGMPFSFFSDEHGNPAYPWIGQVLFFPDGKILVSDPGNGRVLKFSKDRQLMNSVQTSDSGDKKLAKVGPIYVFADGSYAVADIGSSATELVLVYPNGTWQRQPITGIRAPLALAASDSAKQYMAWQLALSPDPSYVNVVLTDPAGDVQVTLLASNGQPYKFDMATDLDIDAVGNIYVTNAFADTVAVFNPDGTFIMSWTGMSQPTGQLQKPITVDVGDDGTVVVASYNSANVTVFSVDLP